jgi:TonB family protein
MIVTWMAAAFLFALLLGAAALAIESAARLLSRQGRAPWTVALAASVVWPVILPLIAREKAVLLPSVVIGTGAVGAFVAKLPALPFMVGSRMNAIVGGLWTFASVVLLARLFRAQRTLRGISRAARPTQIDGHEVLITEDIGPAVVGIASPRVAVPLWLTELDLPLRELVLRHEREHCMSRDTLLVWLGELSVAFMPWNPAVWWQARRLRLALELDCDARTLRDSEAAGLYGKLLLLIAERQRMTRLAPMLAESSSHLSRRITAMTRESVTQKPLRVAALAVAAIIAIVAACSERIGNDLTGPMPTPGKSASLQAGRPTLSGPGTVYKDYQVEQAASFAPGSAPPQYPSLLKQAGVQGEVIASFVVDTTGVADVSTFKVIKSSHQLFTNAVIAAVGSMRFVPALVGGLKVKQLVMLPFEFQIADTTHLKQ